MTNDERNPKLEILNAEVCNQSKSLTRGDPLIGVRHSDFGLLSSFVIRHLLHALLAVAGIDGGRWGFLSAGAGLSSLAGVSSSGPSGAAGVRNRTRSPSLNPFLISMNSSLNSPIWTSRRSCLRPLAT